MTAAHLVVRFSFESALKMKIGGGMFHLHHDFILQDLVTKIEKMEKGAGDKPKLDVVIKDSGVLEVDEPFSIEW